ncbi:23S rRNA (uracil(1939)-C(5))-methyltransferase RlmD [Candidatus Uhrbacteria bacterium]|nr:23S rRNA (uracil(1939)-C(5))-methyltransferase RlmD [Candidatus Uhrbacteria bacterium]
MPSSCPHPAVCGSCSWSHIPYEKQLAQKISDINGSLKLKNLALHCEHILASPKIDHYRNRMDFTIDFEGRIGLREKGKWWRVIDDHPCFLADECIETLFAQIRAWIQTCGLSFYDRKTHQGLLRAAVIRATTLGQTLINIVTSAPVHHEEEQKTREALHVLAKFCPTLTGLVWTINHTDADVSFGDETHEIVGQPFIEERIGQATYRISPNAFFQTNSFAAPLLLDTVSSFCGDLTDKTLLDLYCGTGFFSIALAHRAKKTIGIELSTEAIADAKMNAQINNAPVEYLAAPTEQYDWSVHKADVVILDPPRSGMHDRALADIIRIKPPGIVYVSCNPKNFAREMVQLEQVYRVEEMMAIDMFPHTPHVELVSKLVAHSP